MAGERLEEVVKRHGANLERVPKVAERDGRWRMGRLVQISALVASERR